MKNVLMRIGLAAAILIGASACSVEGLKAWYDANGIPYAHLSDAELQAQAYAITAYMAQQSELSKFNWVLSDEQLFRLRWCESTDNYNAISSSGTYRGAYQFSQSTWNYVAGIHYPQYVGWDPAFAPPQVQDAMARALWHMQGPAPWPVCGYRV